MKFLKLQYHLMIVLALLFTNLSHSQNLNKNPIEVDDLLKIRSITNISTSVDGKWVIYSVKSIEDDSLNKKETKKELLPSYILDKVLPNMNYSYKKRFWNLNLEENSIPYLLDSAKSEISQVVFSPNGNEIAYLKKVDGLSQIFKYDLKTKISKQVSFFSYNINNIIWNRDGNRLVFTTAIPIMAYLYDTTLQSIRNVANISSRDSLFISNYLHYDSPNPDGTIENIRSYLYRNELSQKAKVIRKIQYQTEAGINTAVNLSHIFILDTSFGSTPIALTKGLNNYSSPYFINRNKIIVNSTPVVEDSSLYGLTKSSIYEINIDSNEIFPLKQDTHFSYSIESVSKSGKYLAYQRNVLGKVNIPKIYIYNTIDQKSNDYLIEIDRNLSQIQFSSDENYIYFIKSGNGGSVVSKSRVGTKTFQNLTDSVDGVLSFSVLDKKIIYAKTTISNPSELYIKNLEENKEQQLSHLNDKWLENKFISIPVKHSIVNELGQKVEFWVMKPKGFESNKKYPLLLEMHGGPASMWGPGEESMWHEFQFFTGKGIGVVYGNPRGSNGYGEKFLRANEKDWGTGPAKDVLSYLNKTISEDWVDSSKLLLSGGSYAGYLTAWILSHDHRFLAASSQRGVYDFNTFLGEGDVWNIVPRYFGGYPWTNKIGELLKNQSPINYVQNINTPLLIFIGEHDTRVGTTQSDMLYKSLRLLGKHVEYVRHPNADHELTRSGDNTQRIDQMLRTYEFFYRYLYK
ncbi:S9 family peptidase [Rhizosphaericola mali]|uniref:S9 family peptidase n=1 Tax=Rhizosphaericola mali TaxID=2545455 RepID=A0A5P2G9U1_9BACT|nr:S9 family peptidase [Rhizosphaericola mali]QES88301.1 S9 family peptidase [Rhizosphaericola mali]